MWKDLQTCKDENWVRPPCPSAEVRDRLTAALPAGMPVLAVEEFPIYHETGVLRESIGSVMETQEMLVQVWAR